MNHLEDMGIFVQVVERGNFSAAAGALHISPAKVSVHIARLEKRLRVRLLDRTTRAVTLTPEGSLYFGHCQKILAEIDHVNGQLTSISDQPAGSIRIDVPAPITTNILLPVMKGFLERYPDISVEFVHSEHLFDLGHRPCDAMIRPGPLEDSGLIGVSLGYSNCVVAAAPAYLEKYGEPRTPGELQHHSCIQFTDPRSGRIAPWQFSKEGERRDIQTTGRVTFNEGESKVAAALYGYGIYYGLTVPVRKWIQSGALQVLLKEWQCSSHQIILAYPRHEHQSAKLRVLIDYLRECYAADSMIDPPFWDD